MIRSRKVSDDLIDELLGAGILNPRKYLLWDRFDTARAAGSVNGTPAEPGPGTRVVTDTNNKLSIAGGVASFATGGIGVGDPGLWYGSVPVMLGRAVAGNLNVTLDGLELGWDSNQSGVPLNTIRFNDDDVTLQIRHNGLGVNVGSFSLSTIYSCVVVLRNSAGSFYFIKGGAFSNWTLIWISSEGSSLNFPTVAVVATTSVGTADNVRVPDRLFIPAPLASDSFNRANGALGLTDGAGHAEANGGGGLSWTGSTFSISSNKAINTPTLGSELVVNGNMETGDPPSSWSSQGGATLDGVADERTGGSGAQSLSATRGTNDIVASQTLTHSGGIWFTVSAWAKDVTAGSVQIVVASASINAISPTDVSGIWVNLIATGRATATPNTLLPRCYVNTSGEGRFDDYSVKPLMLSSLFSSVNISTPDVIADVAVTLPSATAGVQAGLVLNLDSASSPANFVIVYLDGQGNVKLDKCVGGTYTNIIAPGITYVVGAVLRVIKDGTKYRVLYNNAEIGTEQTISDAGIINNTRHGLFSTYEGNLLENFIVWARGTGGEYQGLDSM